MCDVTAEAWEPGSVGVWGNGTATARPEARRVGGALRVPDDAVIPWDKLVRYLLVPRPRSDKSRFLAQAGFVADNPVDLLRAIRELAATSEAVADGENEYGVFLRVEALCQDPTGAYCT